MKKAIHHILLFCTLALVGISQRGGGGGGGRGGGGGFGGGGGGSGGYHGGGGGGGGNSDSGLVIGLVLGLTFGIPALVFFIWFVCKNCCCKEKVAF